MDQREHEIAELRAAVRVGEESLDARRKVRIQQITDRLASAPGPSWYLVDRRHQQGGQIQIYTRAGTSADHIANVLARGKGSEEVADLVSNAPQDIRWLLDEVHRLRERLGDRLYEPE